MNIGIDIDDTITETEQFLQPYLSEYFNLNEEYLKENHLTYQSFYENMPKEMTEFGLKTYGSTLLNIPIKEGAKEGINYLKSNGNKIVIITARDKSIYEDPYGYTKAQLKKFEIKYNKLICSFDKRSACIENDIQIFIDDSIKNLNSVKDIVKYEFLFNTSYNINKDAEFERVNNWNELIEKIKLIKA